MRHNLQWTDKESPDEGSQLDSNKLMDICSFLSIEVTNITNAVRLGRKNECSARLPKVKFGDIDHKNRLLRYATKLKSVHKNTGKDFRL